MITIQVVNVNGRLVGRRFSDRWNMAQLGYTSLVWSRNQADVKKFRRFYGEDFVITTVKGEQVGITSEERAMFNKPTINKKVA